MLEGLFCFPTHSLLLVCLPFFCDASPHTTDRCPRQISISSRNILVSRLSKPNPQLETAVVVEVSKRERLLALLFFLES